MSISCCWSLVLTLRKAAFLPILGIFGGMTWACGWRDVGAIPMQGEHGMSLLL
jgi:hypothetical protein